jgi:hypothetical protein
MLLLSTAVNPNVPYSLFVSHANNIANTNRLVAEVRRLRCGLALANYQINQLQQIMERRPHGI